MKTKLLFLLLALVGLSAAAQTVALNAKITSAEPKAVVYKMVYCTNSTTVYCATTATKYTSATIYGYSAVATNAAPTANAGVVYVGFRDTIASLTITNAVPFSASVGAGSYVTSKAPSGTKYDLADLAIRGATGDAVLIVYEQ